MVFWLLTCPLTTGKAGLLPCSGNAITYIDYIDTDAADSFFHRCSLRFVTYQSHQESLILKTKSSFSTSSTAFSISNVEKDAHSVNMGVIFTHPLQHSSANELDVYQLGNRD